MFSIWTGVTQTFTHKPIATTTLPTLTGSPLPRTNSLPPLDKTVTVDTSEPYSATVSFNRAFYNDQRNVRVCGIGLIHSLTMFVVHYLTPSIQYPISTDWLLDCIKLVDTYHEQSRVLFLPSNVGVWHSSKPSGMGSISSLWDQIANRP